VSDPKSDALIQLANIGANVVTGNYPAAVAGLPKLGELLAVLAPAVDAKDLDPGDRAAVDAEVDAEVSKP
jgi:hypothetical protein